MILLITTITLFTSYGILLIYYWRNWVSIPEFLSVKKTGSIRISVVIPARNEEDNIGILLEALQRQSYPKELFEVIVVDDDSSDNTIAIVRQFPFVQLLQLKEKGINSFKKKALETGIAHAGGELIVTTDADCRPSEDWLGTLASFKKSGDIVFIVAPVVFESAFPAEKQNPILSVFQQLDFMMMQGITGAAVYHEVHSMCNGANLAYEKMAFDSVNGFSGIDEIASGDDMLLMHKIRNKYPGKIGYLKSKDAIMVTKPMKTWKEFFYQRVRWASKAGKYKDKSITMVLALVYLVNLSFLVLLLAGFWDHRLWIIAGIYWLAKTLVELPFCISVSNFFNRKKLVPYLLLFQPVHIFYIILSGLLGQFGKYEWKGRKVK